MKKNTPELTAEEKRQSARDAWNDEFRMHNRALTDIHCPKERWSYICNDVKETKMCDALMAHCQKIGLEVERYKFDSADLLATIRQIGNRVCAVDGCEYRVLQGSDYCMHHKRQMEKSANQAIKKRQYEEAMVDVESSEDNGLPF